MLHRVRDARRTPRLSIVVALGCASLVGPAVRAAPPDALEILRRADASTKAVKRVSYDARAFGSGEVATRPTFRGSVKLVRANTVFLPRYHIDVTRVEGDGAVSDMRTFVCDGVSAIVFDKRRRVYLVDHTIRRMSQDAAVLYMREYLHAAPFGDEIEGSLARYEGSAVVGGVDCHQVWVVYSGERQAARWYFGKHDYLPRRVDRFSGGPRAAGANVLELSDVDVDPLFDEQTFQVEGPLGYQDVSPGARQDTLLIGGRAPDWELATSGDRRVRLARLKGDVVVLEFRAPWCRFCAQSAPIVQRLADSFSERRVRFFAIDLWSDSDAKPVEALRAQGGGYPLLLGGDGIARDYRINGVPTYYVIDARGVILYAQDRFTADIEQKLRRAIEAALLRAP